MSKTLRNSSDSKWYSSLSVVPLTGIRDGIPNLLCLKMKRDKNYFESVSCSVLSNSLQPHGLGASRLLSPWNPAGRNTRVGCHSLLQGIFPLKCGQKNHKNPNLIKFHLAIQEHLNSRIKCFTVRKNLIEVSKTRFSFSWDSACNTPLTSSLKLYWNILREGELITFQPSLTFSDTWHSIVFLENKSLQ